MALLFKQSLSVYRYGWVSGRGWPHLREWTSDDTPRENEEQANPKQKASGGKESKEGKKGQDGIMGRTWAVENWEAGKELSSPVERLSSAVLSKTLAISQRKDRSWAGSSRKTKTLSPWKAKVVDVRPSQNKMVFFLGTQSRRKLGEPEGWWYIQQEPRPRGLRDLEVRDKRRAWKSPCAELKPHSAKEQCAVGEWPPPPLLVLGPQRGCPAWPRAGPEGLMPPCLGGREGARKLRSNVWTPAVDTVSLFPSSDSQNLILAALPKREAFASLFDACLQASEPASGWFLCPTIYPFMHLF